MHSVPTWFRWLISALCFTVAGCVSPAGDPDGDIEREICLPGQADLPGGFSAHVLSPVAAVLRWEPYPPACDAVATIERAGSRGQTAVLRPLAGNVEIVDAGLDPDTTYHYRFCLSATGSPAPVCTGPVTAATPAWDLPAGPELTVPYRGGEGEGDLFLFTLFEALSLQDFGAVVVADRTGRVVWQHLDPTGGIINDAELLPDGMVVYNQLADLLVVDLAGRTHARYADPDRPNPDRPPYPDDGLTRTATRFYHHDVDPFGDDAFVSVVFDIRHDDVRGWDILGDGISIFDRATGQERWFVSLFDYYDYRTLYDPIDIEDVFFGIGHDWSHANAIWFDPVHSHFYLHIRNLRRILVVEYPSGARVREIGDDGWTFAHAHDPQYLDDGSIMIFDNGLRRPGGGAYSRALRFREAAGALEELWEYRENPDFFSVAFGDADLLPSGNVLITDSFAGRLVEVDQQKRKVWEMTLDRAGYWIYKTQRIPAGEFRRACGLE